jgi:hypothetical protein
MAASDLNARHNPRHFGRRRGLTLYNHVNNRGEQYWVDVVNCTMREATYVLDGLLYQDAPEIRVNKLLHRKKAWCPQCFQEWRKNRQVVYEPLLWTLSSVNICPITSSRLSCYVGIAKKHSLS